MTSEILNDDEKKRCEQACDRLGVLTSFRSFFRAADSDSDSSSSEEELLTDSESGSDAGLVKPAKANRFLRSAKDSGTDSSSEDEDADDDGDHVSAKKKNRFLKGSSEDESEEDAPKLVKSAKSKRIEEMEACQRSITNAERISDWTTINNGL